MKKKEKFNIRTIVYKLTDLFIDFLISCFAGLYFATT